MTKVFNNKYEIEKYYDEKTNSYVFKEDGKYIDLIVFKFDLSIESDIKALSIDADNIVAWNINAWNIDADNIVAWNIKALDIESRNIDSFDIEARNINAFDINARDIKASNINYYAVCFAYNNIKCKSIKGRKHNAKHFVLDGTLEVEENVD